MTIEKLAVAGFDHFLAYLNDHLSDNGRGDTAYFQPLPRDASHFPAEKAEAFRNGLQIEVGQPGWRRVWVARDQAGAIAGHIDLRGLPENYTKHRCLLGMGVHRTHRQRGLGSQLIAHAENWALLAGVQWVDLQVLSVNAPAIQLYERCGYRKTGEIPNMFLLDGKHYSYTYMTRRLR
ncbi:GNAT family N-acetyltransferase [Duganella sp.]|uniref:GNAT family N-acetyltransferase n=1 Tax=Duganella sp. TaxID=1904440 RepID=UPI0031CF3EAD